MLFILATLTEGYARKVTKRYVKSERPRKG
jgi:hypothetical protein